jgi:hypothetical protein
MSGWVAGAVVGGALISSKASSKAASAQAAATESAAAQSTEAANRAADLQYQQFREGVALQEPWRQAGITALNRLTPLATEYTPFSYDEFTKDPGYAFRLSEGQKALERSATARGNLLSGGTLKAITRYGQDMGSQEYQNAFNRYQAERTARLQPLQSLAGVGQTTAQQMSAAGQNLASNVGNIYTTNAANVGNLMTSGAAARASGYVGSANALNQGLGTYLNYSQNQSMLNALRGPGGFRTPGYGGGVYGGGFENYAAMS